MSNKIKNIHLSPTPNKLKNKNYLLLFLVAFIAISDEPKHLLHVNECINKTTPAISIIHLLYVVSHKANTITTTATISSHQLLHIFNLLCLFLILIDI